MSADSNVFQVAVGLAVGVGDIFMAGFGLGVGVAVGICMRIFDIYEAI